MERLYFGFTVVKFLFVLQLFPVVLIFRLLSFFWLCGDLVYLKSIVWEFLSKMGRGRPRKADSPKSNSSRVELETQTLSFDPSQTYHATLLFDGQMADALILDDKRNQRHGDDLSDDEEATLLRFIAFLKPICWNWRPRTFTQFLTRFAKSHGKKAVIYLCLENYVEMAFLQRYIARCLISLRRNFSKNTNGICHRA